MRNIPLSVSFGAIAMGAMAALPFAATAESDASDPPEAAVLDDESGVPKLIGNEVAGRVVETAWNDFCAKYGLDEACEQDLFLTLDRFVELNDANDLVVICVVKPGSRGATYADIEAEGIPRIRYSTVSVAHGTPIAFIHIIAPKDNRAVLTTQKTLRYSEQGVWAEVKSVAMK